MKLALLGDVHGNADALRVVLHAAAREGAQAILNTGDMVGYYHQPAEVIDLLDRPTIHTVRGNHDDMFDAAQNDPARLTGITRKYGHGLATALATLSPEQVQWLQTRPRQMRLHLGGVEILLCHGSPWGTDHYIYPDAPEGVLTKAAKSAGAADLVVLGHTHYQTQWTLPRAVAAPHPDTHVWAQHLTIVNPGSVGQPRDRKPGAAWALVDIDQGQIDLRREAYDTRPTVQRARDRDPDLDYLWSVLARQ